MKVLFLFKNENFLAPLGLCSISAVAVKSGHKSYLCDINAHYPLEYIARLNPDIIAYSSSTGEAKHYFRLNRLIKVKFPRIFTIMGGPHPTFCRNVIENGCLDAICVGEGDIAFMNLLMALENGGSLDNIPNIVTRNNKNRYIVGNLIEDLDSLPFPDYSLLYDNTPLGSYPLKNFITSRGCPYNCSYCFNSAWRKIYNEQGKIVRRHSVDYVIEGIEYVRKKWPLSCVKFYDDVFTYDVDNWLEEFSKKYKKHVNLPFFILTRVELINKDIVSLLKYAGCRTISMSIEAGNQNVRSKILNRMMSDDQIVAAHRLCDKYGIYTFTNCMVGLPDTTLNNDIESINLAIKARTTWAEFPIFYPYPGTKLGQATIDLGFYKPDYEKMHTSYMYSSLLNCFSKKEKNAHMNITVLGAVAVAFPSLKNLIVNYLIWLPHNIAFTFLYYIVKMYVFRNKIYVTKTTLQESLRIFIRSLRQEWFRHENQKG